MNNRDLATPCARSATAQSNVIQAEHLFRRPEPQPPAVRISATPDGPTIALSAFPRHLAMEACCLLEDAAAVLRNGFVGNAGSSTDASIVISPGPRGKLQLTISGRAGLYVPALQRGIIRAQNELCQFYAVG